MRYAPHNNPPLRSPQSNRLLCYKIRKQGELVLRAQVTHRLTTRELGMCLKLNCDAFVRELDKERVCT